MTPEPALWNCRSRGGAPGGTLKNLRKNGSSSSGLPWPALSLIVPRVATLTTAGETRLTIGASDGIGAASSAAAAITDGGSARGAANRTVTAAAAANLIRGIIRCPLRYLQCRQLSIFDSPGS